MFGGCDFRKCRFVSFQRQADTADMSLVAPGYHRRLCRKTILQSAVEKYKFLENTVKLLRCKEARLAKMF